MRGTVSRGARHAGRRASVPATSGTARGPEPRGDAGELTNGSPRREARYAHDSHSRIGRIGARRRDRQLEEALAQERRRMAADLHDLVMQDLALALANARALAGDPESAAYAEVVVAAGERALAGAREIVGGLLASDRTPIVEALAASTRTAARAIPLRFDAQQVPDGEQPDAPTFDTLVHIAREAVTNAVKHSSPSALEVRLEHDDEWRLSVRDDGDGFDAGQLGDGFGLQSMRQHAQALGGSLMVISAPGAGTLVEALLP
jgi:signal transduction histidine kinase